MSRILTIEPAGGLCNRLRAIHSAACLAKDLSMPLRLIWVMNDGMGARFDQLFEQPDEISRIHTFDKNKKTLLKDIIYEVSRNSTLPFVRPNFGPMKTMELAEAGFDFASLAGKRRIHIKSWSLFYGHDRDFLPFRPLPKLRERIQSASSDLQNAITVHDSRDNTSHFRAR